MERKTLLILGIIILSISMFGMGFGMGTIKEMNKQDDPFGWKPYDMGNYWTCMDGCYFMEHLILGNVDPQNKTHEQYHSVCSDMCWNEFKMNTGVEDE